MAASAEVEITGPEISIGESTEGSEQIIVDEVRVEDIEESLVQEIVETEELERSFASERSTDHERVPEKAEKLVQFPLSRIKTIMKFDPDVSLASQDAVFLIAKAAELFVDTLGKEAYKFTKQNKKKTIQKKDIDDCIDVCDCLAFLEGTLEG